MQDRARRGCNRGTRGCAHEAGRPLGCFLEVVEFSCKLLKSRGTRLRTRQGANFVAEDVSVGRAEGRRCQGCFRPRKGHCVGSFTLFPWGLSSLEMRQVYVQSDVYVRTFREILQCAGKLACCRAV